MPVFLSTGEVSFPRGIVIYFGHAFVPRIVFLSIGEVSFPRGILFFLFVLKRVCFYCLVGE